MICYFRDNDRGDLYTLSGLGPQVMALNEFVSSAWHFQNLGTYSDIFFHSFGGLLFSGIEYTHSQHQSTA